MKEFPFRRCAPGPSSLSQLEDRRHHAASCRLFFLVYRRRTHTHTHTYTHTKEDIKGTALFGAREGLGGLPALRGASPLALRIRQELSSSLFLLQPLGERDYEEGLGPRSFRIL